MWVWAHLNTVVADRTVGAAWRPVEAAGWTPLHPDLDPSDLHRLVQRSTEIVFFVLVLLGSGEDARVHECGHTEVSQNKEEDDAIVDGDGHWETLWEPRTRETEEERGGADEEERCCWHRNVAWGSQGSAGRDYSMREGGRGWTPPSALTTTAWHHFLLAVMCVSTNCYPKSFIISLKSSPRCTEWVWCAGTLILGTKVRKRRF